LKVIKLNECGYDESALGFSLSYNTSIERAKELLPKYAFKNNGENKFLRAIQVWFDITAPIFFFVEMDTYKVSTTRLSSSTMHTLGKNEIIYDNQFEYPLDKNILFGINNKLEEYKNKKISIAELKNNLPDGFLMRIVFNCNYATLQNMYFQREDHRLPQWHIFLDSVLEQLEHPEFIISLKQGE
jgi:hypothetical protein